MQKALRRLESESLIVPVGSIAGGRGQTVEYRLTLTGAGKGALGTHFESRKERTSGHKRMYLKPGKGARGTPESSLTTQESAAAAAVGSVVAVASSTSKLEKRVENRRPPLESGTRKSDDDERKAFSILPSGEAKQDIDRRYSDRVDQFREAVLAQFIRLGYDRYFLNLALDEIDQRAWVADKRIASAAYFAKGIENLLGDRAAVERIQAKLKKGRRSPCDIELDNPMLPPEIEQERQFLNICIAARDVELLNLREMMGAETLRDGRGELTRIGLCGS